MLSSNIILKCTTNGLLAALKQSKAGLHLTSTLEARKTFSLKTAYGEPPLHNEDKYLEAKENGKLEELAFKRIRFSRLWESDSLFFDEDYERYLRRVMRDGRRGLIYHVLHNACYEIKCKQFARLEKQKAKIESGKAKEEDEEPIELDPVALISKALNIMQPHVITKKVKRGGATYQVPFPVTKGESDWLVMMWLHDSIRERPRPRKKSYAEVFAEEIISASQGYGKMIKIRDDIHRLAQANKAYSHFRWG